MSEAVVTMPLAEYEALKARLTELENRPLNQTNAEFWFDAISALTPDNPNYSDSLANHSWRPSPWPNIALASASHYREGDGVLVRELRLRLVDAGDRAKGAPLRHKAATMRFLNHYFA